MNTLFFVTAKVAGLVLRVETWLLFALVALLLAQRVGRTRLAARLAALLLAALLAITVFPFGHLLLAPLERTFPANPTLTRVDGIFLLGGAEDARGTGHWQQVQLNDAAERLTATAVLARRFPDARIVVSGGSGAMRDLGRVMRSEADVAERFLLEQGIAPSRLLRESQSRNTAENARLALARANPNTDEVWVVVTSAFHMPRTVRTFEAAGWPQVVPYPVDYRTTTVADGLDWDLPRHLLLLNLGVREWVGHAAYALTGR